MYLTWNLAGERDMSRNKIEMSKYIFNRIHASAIANDPNYLSDGKGRWITPIGQEDLDLMAYAEVNVLTLGAKMFAVSIKHGPENYFCFSGLETPQQLPINLDIIDPTPGLFACVVFCAELQALSTEYHARNTLEQQHFGQDNYNGHELSEILPHFQNLLFLKEQTKNNTPYLDSLERVAGAFIASGYESHPLEVNDNLRSRILTLFESGAETIPFGLPLQGLLSYNWPSLFLDLYRCLEQLYTVLKLKSLVTKMPYKGALAELAYLLEEELSWRPKELDALASILTHSSEDTRSKILSAFKIDVSALTEYSPNKCAINIYKLRNSHVHFRPAMKAENRSSKEWNEILIAMCDAVDDVYEALGIEFLKDRSNVEVNV
jgi:hypothetical protein